MLLVRESIFGRLASVFANKFSYLSLAFVVSAASLLVYASGERTSFQTWAKFYYGQNYRTLAAEKATRLPPVDDALAFVRLEQTADDDFSRSLQSNSFWRKRGGSNASKYIKTVKRSNLIGSGEDFFADPFASLDADSRRRRVLQSGLFRTMCVRSCDGFMWPVSFSTTQSNFDVDERVCRNSCAAPTRLYYYENPGQEPDQMVDLRGRSYNLLPTAWRFQKQHVSSCKCRPDPWEPQALARHAKFAALQKKGKLKSYLRKASRKAKRMSRRASIGHIVVNSSVWGGSELSVRAKKRTAKKRKVARRKARVKPKWGGAKGFSSKSYASSSGASIRSLAFRNKN